METTETAQVRVFLLGRFVVEIDGREIPAAAWRKRRPVELLVALVLAPGRLLHREELIDRLWPDKDLAAGANNLHRALHDLRKTTGLELARLDRGVARLADNVWVDVAAFEQLTAASEPQAWSGALELYRGDLLPDDPYSDALSARREGLRQRFVDTALRLAEQYESSGERDACIGVLRAALRADPALERAHQMLMRALASAGRASDALRQFAECVTALRERLDLAPSQQTSELRASIERGELSPRASEPAASPSPVRMAPIGSIVRRLLGSDAPPAQHGRAEAIAQVVHFAAAERGTLLIFGEAGLGKTRLAAECLRAAAARGATILAGLGSDLDAGLPYAPFADAWSDLRRQTPDRGAGLHDPFLAFSPSGGSAQEDRLRLFQAIERAIEALAVNAPLCLLIEDLHQADESSLQLFHHLARAARRLPLLLIGTVREEEVRVGRPLHTLVGSLGRERLAARIVLERLDRAASHALVAQLLGPVLQTLSDAIFALAEGNPFYTEEVALVTRGAGAPPSSLTIPNGLLDTVRVRVRGLGRDSERLLSAAAIAGLRFSFELAQQVSGLTPDAALDGLEAALEAHIVEQQGAEYCFRHGLTRKALLESLTHARRVHLHARTADVLEALPAQERERWVEALALHLEQAGLSQRALPYTLAAAERAQQLLGFTEAIGFFSRARVLLDATGGENSATAFRVLRSLGGMSMALSDLDSAVRDLDAAAALGDAGWRPNASEILFVRRIAALALIQAGRLDEAQQRLELALAALPEVADQREAAGVYYLFAQLRWHQERFGEARDFAHSSLREAEHSADPAAIARGHEMVALACHSLGDWDEGRDHERARQALATGSLDVDQAFDVHLCLWEYHLYGDRGSGTIRGAVDQTLQQARRMGAPRAIALCRAFSGALDFQLGRWDAASEELNEALELFRQVGSASGEALSLQRLGVLLTARGQLDPARALLDEGIAVGGRAAMRSHCCTRLHAAMTRNRLAAADLAGAARSLHEGWAEAERHGRCASCSSLLLPEAVRVEIARADLAQAERRAAALEQVARRFNSRTWTAMAEQARGRVLAARGSSAQAFDSLESARRAFSEVGYVYEAVRCSSLQVRVLLERGPEHAAHASALEQAARAAHQALGSAALEL